VLVILVFRHCSFAPSVGRVKSHIDANEVT
jgi:hypothetical protein